MVTSSHTHAHTWRICHIDDRMMTSALDIRLKTLFLSASNKPRFADKAKVRTLEGHFLPMQGLAEWKTLLHGGILRDVIQAPNRFTNGIPIQPHLTINCIIKSHMGPKHPQQNNAPSQTTPDQNTPTLFIPYKTIIRRIQKQQKQLKKAILQKAILQKAVFSFPKSKFPKSNFPSHLKGGHRIHG
jgi:hypothetical protein